MYKTITFNELVTRTIKNGGNAKSLDGLKRSNAFFAKRDAVYCPPSAIHKGFAQLEKAKSHAN